MRISDWSSDVCSSDLDHGAQRYVLFEFDGEPAKAAAPCPTPAMAWIDAPVSGASVGWRFEVAGWAFQDGPGLSGVEVLLVGKPVAIHESGLANPGTAGYLTTPHIRIESLRGSSDCYVLF